MQAAAQPHSTHSTLAPTLALLAAAICFGSVPFFAKSLLDAGMPAASIAFCRYVAVFALTAPFIALRRGAWRRSAIGALAGAAMSLGWIGYLKALESMSVATAGVLYMTYPVFALALGWLIWRERPARRALAGAALIAAAAGLAAPSISVSGASAAAVLLTLAAPAAFGFGINVVSRTLAPAPWLSRSAAISVGCLAGLAPVVFADGIGPAFPPEALDWVLIAGIGLATAAAPQLIYAVAAPKVGAARTAATGAIELPVMMLIGWIAFGQPLGPLQILAGAMICAAIALTPARRAAAV